MPACVLSICPDEQVLLLYKELYFRHIYAKLTPTVDDKFDSFQTYVDLFNLLRNLDTDAPDFELPTSWMWDIIGRKDTHERVGEMDHTVQCAMHNADLYPAIVHVILL